MNQPAYKVIGVIGFGEHSLQLARYANDVTFLRINDGPWLDITVPPGGPQKIRELMEQPGGLSLTTKNGEIVIRFEDDCCVGVLWLHHHTLESPQSGSEGSKLMRSLAEALACEIHPGQLMLLNEVDTVLATMDADGQIQILFDGIDNDGVRLRSRGERWTYRKQGCGVRLSLDSSERSCSADFSCELMPKVLEWLRGGDVGNVPAIQGKKPAAHDALSKDVRMLADAVLTAHEVRMRAGIDCDCFSSDNCSCYLSVPACDCRECAIARKYC